MDDTQVRSPLHPLHVPHLTWVEGTRGVEDPGRVLEWVNLDARMEHGPVAPDTQRELLSELNPARRTDTDV